MATIDKPVKLKNKLWKIRIRFYDNSKTPHQKLVTVKAQLKQQVLVVAEQVVEAYNHNSFDPWLDELNFSSIRPTKEITIKQAVSDYFEHTKRLKKWSDNNAKNNVYIFNAFKQKIGPELPINQLTGLLIENYFAELEISWATATGYAARIKSFLQFVKKQKWIKEEIEFEIPQRKQDKGITYFTQNDVEQLKETIYTHTIAAAEHKHARPPQLLWLIRFIDFLFYSGLRLNEALSLKVSDIDSIEEVIYIKNEKAKRTEQIHYGQIVPLKKVILDQFAYLRKVHKAEPGRLFFLHAGSARVSKTIKKFIKITFPPEKAERLKTHSLRHGTGTFLVNAGVSLPYVQEYMRHKDIKTTLNYAKVMKKEMNEKVGEAFSPKK